MKKKKTPIKKEEPKKKPDPLGDFLRKRKGNNKDDK